MDYLYHFATFIWVLVILSVPAATGIWFLIKIWGGVAHTGKKSYNRLN